MNTSQPANVKIGHTSGSADFDMQRIDSNLLAPDSYVLGC